MNGAPLHVSSPKQYLSNLFLTFSLTFLSYQSPETWHMEETLTASRVRSHLSSWERLITPAPQTDAQMGSSGAPQLQTMRKTRNTLSVLRRTVRFRDVQCPNLVLFFGRFTGLLIDFIALNGFQAVFYFCSSNITFKST